MNKNNVLILGFIVVLITFFGFYNTAKAASPSVYISPTSANQKVGDIFDISIGVNPDGEKTCMVEGKLVLDKLSCQSVSLADNVMASPDNKLTCDNLYFSLGIPRCTTSDKPLFTVTVKAESSGSGTASFTGVDIIGEGVSTSSTSSSGSYAITSPCICGTWSAWQDGACGGGSCSSNQRLQTRTRTCTPSGCEAKAEYQCKDDSGCVSRLPATEDEIIGEEEKEEEEPASIAGEEEEEEEIKKGEPVSVSVRELPQVSLLASLREVLTFKGIGQSSFLIIVVVLCLIGLVFIGIKEWRLFQKRKKK